VPGSTVPYAFAVSNTTPVVAPDVIVTDTLPVGLSFVSADNPACTSADGVTITCALGLLAPGASVTINVVAQAASPFPPDDVAADGTVANTASVTSPGTNCPPDATEPEPACSSTVALPVPSQLSITKSTAAAQVLPGASFSYALTVSNAGPLAADATITDQLPVGVSFVSADNAGCSFATGVLTCAVGPVAVADP
jgi:uncharacterized repeat protein (TIGR01451 family)